ncbi:MAG: patatin-like phospholipase family protein [Halothiobacillaceae bacterium]|jgi:NTE family protein|nr:patatin-like phospholipase family protein [Halothiobacillaceae bacterium]
MAQLERSSVSTPSAHKVGLALGSGSARGLAHIGVLRAIEEAGIEVDCIAGTSIGAVIGAIYSAGKLEGLTERFLQFDWKRIISLLDPVFPRSGLIDGQKIDDFVRAHVQAQRIEDLPIPFRAVATCIMSGEEVVVGAGDLIEAVRASISVPGIFTPLRSNGRILVDGGLVNPVPVSVARAMGADLIIAVDRNHNIVAHRTTHPQRGVQALSSNATMTRLLTSLQAVKSQVLAQFEAWLHQEPLPGIFDVLLNSIYIMQARVTQTNLRHDKPDILIQPPLGAVRFIEFDRAEEIIEIGYRSAAEQLARWKAMQTHD